MTTPKRIMDIVLGLLLAVVLFPVYTILALLIMFRDGRPVLYVSERMRTADQGFMLWKFRTMTTSTKDAGVSGGDKVHRITKTGVVMRRFRLDEIPQLYNILRGDISFVGPRPPLRRYVEQFPELYTKVLRSRPGVTGLATLAFHRREEQLLAACQTPEETEAVYVTRCIPIKARLDLIYASDQGLCWDLRLMVATVIRSVSLRAKRLKQRK